MRGPFVWGTRRLARRGLAAAVVCSVASLTSARAHAQAQTTSSADDDETGWHSKLEIAGGFGVSYAGARSTDTQLSPVLAARATFYELYDSFGPGITLGETSTGTSDLVATLAGSFVVPTSASTALVPSVGFYARDTKLWGTEGGATAGAFFGFFDHGPLFVPLSLGLRVDGYYGTGDARERAVIFGIQGDVSALLVYPLLLAAKGA